MKLRHLILWASILFTCLLIAHPIYLYLYPFEAVNTLHLVITELVYITSGTTLILSLFLLRKNIIKRQLLEEKEHQQKDLLQAVLDCSPYMIYIKDLEGRYVLVNNKVKEFLELPPDQATLTEMESFKNSESKIDTYKAYDQHVVKTKKMVAFEDTNVHGGKLMHFYQLKYPVFDTSGEVKHICGVSVDITELKEAQLKMAEAKEEAIEAKKNQEEFLAYITHDIRTPMNGLLGLTDLLLVTNLTEDQKQYVNYIGETATNLLLLVNDILDFSKIQSGKFNIESKSFILREVVQRAVYPLEKMATAKNLYLHANIDASIPNILIGDPLRLEQMLTNLVGNSIKFTSNGGIDIKIVLHSEHQDGVTIQINISDTGIGIAPDKLGSIFNQFEQVGVNTSRFYEGTGLGLAIVKQLVQLQKGSITVTSELGSGATFSILLPYAKATLKN